MAVSGLIINFLSESGPPAATMAALRDHPRIEVGEPVGHRLPVVMESGEETEASDLWEWLRSLPGVAAIELAYLHFEDEDEQESPVRTEGFLP